MDRINLNIFFRILLITILTFSLTTCTTSKRTTKSSTSKLFRIPQKVVNTDDLPEQLREGESKEEHVVQLFPEEIVEAEAVETEVQPQKVNEEIIGEENKTEPTYVDEITRPFLRAENKVKYYHIVSGSFLTKLYAEMFVERLQKMGYINTYMKLADNGFYRVIVQKYPNEVEARQYLHGYRDDNPQYVTAWLYYLRNGDNGQLAFYQYN